MKIQKKVFVVIYIVLIIILKFNNSYADNTMEVDNNTITNQEETFGINSFIKNAKQYTGKFFEDTDIDTILSSAINGDIDNSTIYKKILKIFGSEVQTRN